MTVRERMLALKIKEKQDKNLEYAQKLGIHVKMIENENKDLKKKE